MEDFVARKRKTAANATVDMISDLPRNLIDCILEHLPIEDAVRTSILSSKWRHNWITLPQLVFDEQFYNICSSKELRLEFSRIINTILLNHRGTVSKFVLVIPPWSPSSIKSYIDQWILLLSKNGIKDFTLEIQARRKKHVLPSCFFSSLDLTHLKLGNFIFRPSVALKGFHHLISLHFHEVKFENVTFEILMASCPLVEDLSFDSCTGLGCLDFYGPNLKTLRVIAGNDVKSINFRDTKNLTKLSISFCWWVNSWMFLGCLPRLEKLCFGFSPLTCVDAGTFPKRLPSLAIHLRNLEILALDLAEVDGISYALCLIRSSPNLQELKIWVAPSRKVDMEPVFNYFEEQGCNICTLDKLRTVRINVITPLKLGGPELKFMKLLLASSPSLVTMTVGVLDEEDASASCKVFEELLKFQKASPQAEIIFLLQESNGLLFDHSLL